MNAPTLFELCGTPVNTATTTTRLHWDRPGARASDPITSHEAAAAVKPGSRALVNAIREAVGTCGGVPATAFLIAWKVNGRQPDRWSEASIRTAISRAGLRAVDTEGKSPRGQRCIRYSL